MFKLRGIHPGQASMQPVTQLAIFQTANQLFGCFTSIPTIDNQLN